MYYIFAIKKDSKPYDLNENMFYFEDDKIVMWPSIRKSVESIYSFEDKLRFLLDNFGSDYVYELINNIKLSKKINRKITGIIYDKVIDEPDFIKKFKDTQMYLLIKFLSENKASLCDFISDSKFCLIATEYLSDLNIVRRMLNHDVNQTIKIYNICDIGKIRDNNDQYGDIIEIN